MGTANATPASGGSPPPEAAAWLGRLISGATSVATSWVGGLSAYIAALIIAAKNFRELSDFLKQILPGAPLWLGVAVIAALPVLALIFHSIPAFIEQRRIKRYSEITGAIQTGYFTLRPRENEEGFERADNAHREILRWIENTKEPVLYLTGASGTGKSSLLSAWVIPKLGKHVVIQLRGYEDDLLARIKEKLLEPGVIWDKAPGRPDDLRSLLGRATQRLGGRRLLIVVDQFEEFLILKDEGQQKPFRQFLSEKPIEGLTFLLVFRQEYEGLINDQPWPKPLDTNREVIWPFTENAAQEFVRKSGLTVNPGLMRAVLREAAEIEQTAGLIRPVTINMCGLVLSRFASGLPRRFRGGIIRGFLRESLSLPEVRDVAGKLIPQLISGNVTKRPRTVANLAQATALAPSAVRACLRRLGERDRAIVRPLDQPQETWEISHDFLVPLLDSIVARRTVSWWRRFRPWLPWIATALMGIAAITIPLIMKQDPIVVLTRQGWTVGEDGGILRVERYEPIPPASIPILRGLPAPFSVALYGPNVTDVSALRELKNLRFLRLHNTNVRDVSALRELKNLTELEILGASVADVSALRGLTNLTQLDLSFTSVTDVSALRGLTNLRWLALTYTNVKDVSALRELKNLRFLNLSSTYVRDVSALRGLTNLKILQ